MLVDLKPKPHLRRKHKHKHEHKKFMRWWGRLWYKHKHKRSSYAYVGAMFSEDMVCISIKCSLVGWKSFAYAYAYAYVYIAAVLTSA